MKKTLNTYEIANELLADDNADWTRSGALALAEHLEQLEEDCGIEIELDCFALRCEYNEYADLIDWACSYYGSDQWRDCLGISGEGEEEEEEEAISIYIHEQGQLIEFDGGVIVSNF